LTAARQAAGQAAVEAATRAGLDPTTAGGLNDMTPAQQARELARQQKAIEAAEARARREAERQRRADEKVAVAAAKARQKTIDTALRTGGKVVTSRLGQDIVRGVFGVLFGGGKGR
jgi:sRNA-binding protein